MYMTTYCQKCLRDKRLPDCPPDASPERVQAWRRRVGDIIASGTHLSSPEVDHEISLVYRELFGPPRDFGPIKRHFNRLMLSLEPDMRADTARADDPLARAVQYAMMGNFIDFAALDRVDEDKLRALLAGAAGVPVDAAALEALREDVLHARKLTLFTDNCGEIVCDKVLLHTLRAMNPCLSVTVVTRGESVVNDATPEDAAQVGMADVARAIIGNGTGIAGNPLGRVSEAARRAAAEADVLISKGQANFETLSGCGLNVYYIFLCKCQLFMDRFGVPRFTGILTREGAFPAV